MCVVYGSVCGLRVLLPSGVKDSFMSKHLCVRECFSKLKALEKSDNKEKDWK